MIRRPARRVYPWRSHRSAGAAPGLRRRRGGVPRADCVVEADSHRSPHRHAAGMSGCRWSLRRAYDIVELWGAAKVPHAIVRRSRVSSIADSVRATSRVPCGRRIRHSRRTLPEDFLVCVASHAAWAADQVDRGPFRAHDVRKSFATAAPSAADGVDAAAIFWAWTTSSLSTRGPMCGRMGRACRHDAEHLAGPYRVPAFRAAGHFRLTNKTPAATYRSPGRYESTLCASDFWT